MVESRGGSRPPPPLDPRLRTLVEPLGALFLQILQKYFSFTFFQLPGYLGFWSQMPGKRLIGTLIFIFCAPSISAKKKTFHFFPHALGIRMGDSPRFPKFLDLPLLFVSLLILGDSLTLVTITMNGEIIVRSEYRFKYRLYNII